MQLPPQQRPINRDSVPAYIRYNYFEANYLVNTIEQLVATWPRSFCVGVFGLQSVDVNYNRLSNTLLDFEAIVALRVTALTVSYSSPTPCLLPRVRRVGWLFMRVMFHRRTRVR